MDNAQPHILVVDDDREIRDLLGKFLEKQSFRVTVARDAREARKLWPLGRYHLVVLDLMMPGESGLDFARWLRSQSEVPVVMLTAMGEETDRIVGLELGADDYVAKPFNPRELLARIRAVLRRRSEGGSEAAPAAVMRFGTLEIDRNARSVTVGGALADLTSYQFDLLVAMAERAGRVLTRDQIMEAVRGRELEAFDRSIDVHMGRIRAAIEADAKNPKRILTVRGVGYVFAKQQD
jgi:DNA-binding response OmpR family regulator